MRRCVFVLALLSICTTAALADDGAIEGVGGALQPMKDQPSVVMERMEVDLHVNADQPSRVECRFTFHNTGPAVTVRMGFPESGGGADVDPRHPHGFLSFQTWVDGKLTPTTIESAPAGEESWQRWRVKSVRFAANQIRKVRVIYTTDLGGDISGGQSFEYQIGTGGSWKGPIGSARIRLFPTYDSDLWTMGASVEGATTAAAPSPEASAKGGKAKGKRRVVPSALEPGPNGSLVWTARGFEPEPGASFRVYFQPVRERVVVGQDLMDLGALGHEPLPAPYYRRGGILFAPVRVVAGLVGAQVAASVPEAQAAPAHDRRTREKASEAPRVIPDTDRPLDSPQPGVDYQLRCGPHFVVLRLGQQWMLVDGKRVTLPAAPAELDEALAAPLAPLAQALGATVAYDPKQHLTRLTCPLQQTLEAALPPGLAGPVYTELCGNGWLPPDTHRFSPEVQDWVARHGLRAPWVTTGDFDGDGLPDAALFLVKGREFGLAVLRHEKSPDVPRSYHPVFDWVGGPPSEGASPYALGSFLRTVKPGVIAYYPEDSTESGKSGRLDLKTDAIEVVILGKAAVMYYWEAAQGRYQRVITAD